MTWKGWRCWAHWKGFLNTSQSSRKSNFDQNWKLCSLGGQISDGLLSPYYCRPLEIGNIWKLLLLWDENFEHSLDSFKHKFLLEYRIFFHLNNSDKTKNPNELKSQTSVVKILFTWKHSFQHIVRFPLLYSDDLIDVIVTPLGDLLDMMFDKSLRFCTKFLQYLKMIGDMFWDMTWVLTRDLIIYMGVIL